MILRQIYLQFVFAVKYRAAVIERKWATELFAVIGNLINETGCKTIIVNGVEDYMHCFVGLRSAVSPSELMKVVKAKSSKYGNDSKLTLSGEFVAGLKPAGKNVSSLRFSA